MNHSFSPVQKRQSGFSLLEMIVYIAILSFLVSIVVLLLSGIINSEKRSTASKNIQLSAIAALDRLNREIRQAESVNLAQSQLGTTAGALHLNTTNPAGGAETISFSLEDGVIEIVESGTPQGPITLPGVTVTSLMFHHIPTPNSEAVRIQMNIESGSGVGYREETFYSTAILRGSY